MMMEMAMTWRKITDVCMLKEGPSYLLYSCILFSGLASFGSLVVVFSGGILYFYRVLGQRYSLYNTSLERAKERAVRR